MYSSSWIDSERQGQIGDLGSKCKEELCEILLRQEKLLRNKRFIQTLPDKGKKISDFVQRVRLALDRLDKEEREQASLSSVRTEFQSKYQQALTGRQPDACTDSVGSDTAGGNTAPGHEEKSAASLPVPGMCGVDEQREPLPTRASAAVTMETSPAGDTSGASLCTTDRTAESDLAEALDRVTLSEQTAGSSGSAAKDALKSAAPNNPFLGKLPQKKPHYIEILEKMEKKATVTKPKYKPNQLVPKTGSPSPSRSPGAGGTTPLSAEARRQRDRKHLDDITSARLPPLHHSPAQLLSLEQSVSLLREQTRKQEELQAKLAAQKLSEGLSFGMGGPHPEGGALAAYREVHDDGTQLSSEED